MAALNRELIAPAEAPDLPRGWRRTRLTFNMEQ
jgi:hypothetical protein